MKYAASGRPAPRYGPENEVLVNTPCDIRCMVWMSYASGTKRIENAPAASAALTNQAPIWNSDFERSARILPLSSSASSP